LLLTSRRSRAIRLQKLTVLWALVTHRRHLRPTRQEADSEDSMAKDDFKDSEMVYTPPHPDARQLRIVMSGVGRRAAHLSRPVVVRSLKSVVCTVNWYQP